MSVTAVIPARMGSQRLKKKNLRELAGIPLIVRAIRRCKAAGVFDEIWVNSEHRDFEEIAHDEGVQFHHRPEALGSNTATSEQFIAEFLQQHECTWMVHVHGIAPLVPVSDVASFVEPLHVDDLDVLLSCEAVQIECAMDGRPVNFSFEEKTNSQDLTPVQRITWSLAAWRRETFLRAHADGHCATWSGRVDYQALHPLACHVIKTELDLQVAEALLPLVEQASGPTC